MCGHLLTAMVVRSKETLWEELNRLLDLGEPLLILFPQQYTQGSRLQLPGNVSPEMGWYANYVAWRAWNREKHQNSHRQEPTSCLAELVKDLEVGLWGWRAIGPLR